MSTRFAPFAFLAAVGITFLQTAAFAAPVAAQGAQRTVLVSVKDLNLANPADVTRLDARIARAAKAACEPGDWRNLKELTMRPSCESSAIAAATPKKEKLVAMAQSAQLAASRPETGNTAD